MTLPTSYADGNTVHASDLNAWDTAINANTNVLNGTTSGGATLVNPTITGYTETVQSLGTVTSTKTIGALTNGTFVTATLTASTACTFTMPTKVAGQSFVLLLKQAASTGAGTATFTGVKWPASTAPTQTTTAATMDVYSFFTDGTDWYGSVIANYTP
jgi:hypothetical protein